ncbi:uncharacterized protein B4U80_12825 [Leptotrombidium deliense]|uniref:Uncharacterized protein n=1 Tax=Leptotrombidium deliense TaxID=299467 RepID=A0A443SKC3_9ACAR|nr:uncharacterized protein B4U80_12825 [Leptotrombidium deliense]
MRYTPMVPQQSSSRVDIDDPDCYDPMRAVMNSWTPRFDEAPDWSSAYSSRSSPPPAPSRNSRDDVFQYRGPMPGQIQSNFDNSRYFNNHSVPSYESARFDTPTQPVRSILKGSRQNDGYDNHRGNSYNSCREAAPLPAPAPAPDLKDAEEEDSFLYGAETKEPISHPPHSVPQRSQIIDVKSVLIEPIPSAPEVRRASHPPQSPLPLFPTRPFSQIPQEKKQNCSYNSQTPPQQPTPPPSAPLPITAPPTQPEEKSEPVQQPSEPVQNNPVSISQLPRIPKVPQKPQENSTEISSKQVETNEDSRNETEEADNKAEEIEKLSQERERYDSQLTSLKALLDKTLKKEADLLRNRPQKTGSRDPQVIENQKLMADVRKRIEMVHDKHTEVSKKISKLQGETKNEETPVNNNAEDQPIVPSIAISNRRDENDDDEDDSDARFEYYDAGNHWCTDCDEIISKMKPYCEHLHSKDHWKKMDSDNEPWKPKNPKLKVAPSTDRITTAMKGNYFIPIKGFYCTLCATFTGNGNHAEEHLKTAKHNRAYMANRERRDRYKDKSGKENKEREREKRKAHSSSRESSPVSIRDPSPEVPDPKNDRKLKLDTIVCISNRDYRRAYKAHLKSILKQNKRRKVSSESTETPLTTTITPVLDNNEECEIDTGDIMASINEKCNDFDAMKEENYGLENDVCDEKDDEEVNHNSPPKSENSEEDVNFEVKYSPTKNFPHSTQSSKSSLVVVKQIVFDEDDDYMQTSKICEEANSIAGPLETASDGDEPSSMRTEDPVVNNVMFPVMDLNDLTKSPPYTANFHNSDDLLNHIDYN